jgi:aminoglycoside phosphotransferase family enzyme/predicted kinase
MLEEAGVGDTRQRADPWQGTNEPHMTGHDRAAGTASSCAQVVETNCAVVLMFGDRAYKIKKPVNLEFLDFRSRPERARVCRREVELNRRLSSDVYLGVADVLDPAGELCEHVVVMRRMPAPLRLSTLVSDGAPVEDHLRRLARLIAAFHSAAPTRPEIVAEGGVAALRRRWTANLSETQRFRGRDLPPELHAEIGHLAGRYLDGRAALFRERSALGLIRDGHGDLLADDIYCLPDGPRVLDCLEFDDRLRWVDVLDDAAFLAVDLERLGRPDLGRLFLDEWAAFIGFPLVPSLEHHYMAYRAFVRAKVALLRGEQGDQSDPLAARDLAGIALRHLRAAAVTMVLVGGAPGTGKTTLTAGLAQQLGWVALSTDDVRRELASTNHQDCYSPGAKQATYAELLRRASTALNRGESVIADATWTSGAERAQAREVALVSRSDLVELQCRAPIGVAAERAEQRLQTGASRSDAGRNIATTLASQADPWPEAVPIDTLALPEEALAAALKAVNPHARHPVR